MVQLSEGKNSIYSYCFIQTQSIKIKSEKNVIVFVVIYECIKNVRVQFLCRNNLKLSSPQSSYKPTTYNIVKQYPNNFWSNQHKIIQTIWCIHYTVMNVTNTCTINCCSIMRLICGYQICPNILKTYASVCKLQQTQLSKSHLQENVTVQTLLRLNKL